MSFLIENWYLFVVALVSGALLFWPMLKQGGGADSVSPADAVQLMNRERAVLVDVREPDEYAAGHVAHSKSVPLATLEASRDLPKNKALPVVLLCATGARASSAVPTLKKLGFSNVRSLSGGLGAWRAANLPVEKTT